MTDAVLSTQPANTPVALHNADLLPGSQAPTPPTPNVVPPYSGANQNGQTVVGPSPFPGSASNLAPLSSIGAYKLSNPLNQGGLTGPASVLAGLSTGAISMQNVP